MQPEGIGVYAYLDLRHKAARGVGFWLERDLVNTIGDLLRKDIETGINVRAAAGKAGVEQGKRVFELAGVGAGERVTFRALQPGVDDKELIGLADGDGLRRVAEFPVETVRGNKPNMAGGSQRLRQCFQ